MSSTINLVRAPANGTTGEITDQAQTFAGSKTWNDAQSWKSASGTVSTGSYDASGNWTLGASTGGNLTHLVQAAGTVELKIFSPNTGSTATTLSIRNSSGTSYNDGFKMTHGAGAMKFQDLNGNGLGQIGVTNGGNWTIGDGTNTTSAHFAFVNAVDVVMRFKNNSTSAAGTPVIQIEKAASGTGSTSAFIDFYTSNSTQNGRIAGNGANAAAFTTISDATLKENVVNLPNQLSNIMALRPVEFDYKDGSGHQIGFIAQEMQTVYPDAVSTYTDNLLGISGWDKTSARLVKALQELKQEFDAYVAAHP